MKFSRSIVLAVALIFAWATAGFAAHSAEICQKRIESFNYLVDYSGSMMMNFPSVGKTKMAVAKEVIKRVNDMVPELGYQGGLYTFAPYGAVVNQGPWVRSTLAAGVDSLKDNPGNLRPLHAHGRWHPGPQRHHQPDDPARGRHPRERR